MSVTISDALYREEHKVKLREINIKNIFLKKFDIYKLYLFKISIYYNN